MKKLFLLAATVFTLSQTANAQLYFGPEIGATMSQLSFQNDAAGFGTSSSSGLGVKIGGMLEVPFSNHWYFQPGLFWDMRTSNASQTYLNNKANDYTWRINSIELPVNFVLKTHQEGHHRLWFAVGGYASYGMGGRLENTDYNAVPYSYYAGETITLSNAIDYGGKNPSSLARLDYGAQANVAFEFPVGLFIRAGYSKGFANRAPYSNLNYQSSSMSLTVGYIFGGNRNFIIP
ncbi:MAG: PorT family protein [Flavipsychrobacter sp.]|nr:PorT family protein [Flavipsychrobacter sp.]